jgi:hypothetical protein
MLEEAAGRLSENIFFEEKMSVLEEAILELASDDTVRAELPELDGYVRRYISAKEGDDIPSLECALLELYLRLHAVGAEYSPAEKSLLESRRGITCHPGGLSPLIMAERFIGPESTVADLGAGNGLQGLLLQRISPHQRTLQIELSAGMLRVGRIYQQALGIGRDRVEWVNRDIADASIEDADFIYIYRPAKPLDSGNELYKSIAGKLAAVKKPLVIFSVADCLSKFLDEDFSVFYSNDYLTCFLRK